MAAILLVDDDITFTQILGSFLIENGHSVDIVHNCKKAILRLEEKQYELYLLDYRLPDGTGLDVLNASKEMGFQVPAVMMTSFNDVRTAVKAMRMGTFDYITKPIHHEELLMAIEMALDNKQKPRTTKIRNNLPEIVIGEGSASKKLNQHIELIAPTDMSVIIQGESGTGKENIARSIHYLSKRKKQPFVAIDCGALSKDLASSELFGHVKGAFTGALNDKKGKFEFANGGTLFLDEIGNLSYDVQVKLLRAIQERVVQAVGSNHETKVNVRIVAATNDDLLKSVSEGNFREDLYHRLNEFKIMVPPLRERQDDLLLFVKHFINESNNDLGREVEKISKEVLDIFEQYDWPGNLRELKNIVKRLVLLTPGKVAEKEGLPEEMLLSLATGFPGNDENDLKSMNEKQEKELIIGTLQKVKFNKSKAAKLLKIDRSTLYGKMKKYGIE